jgi:hypothetical protein
VEDGGAVLPRIIEELVVALDIAAGEGLGDDIFGQRRAAKRRRTILRPPATARRSVSSERYRGG